MTDIELVIKIPEGLKNDFESEQWTALSCMEMKNALENAVPLPKGHGKLIDADAIIDTLGCSDRDMYVKACIEEDAPTIVEADKAESEVQR